MKTLTEFISESKGYEHVTIHAPGHKMHGKVAKVLYKHPTGRINVQLQNSPKKGDVSNYHLKYNEYKPHKIAESVVPTSDHHNQRAQYHLNKAAAYQAQHEKTKDAKYAHASSKHNLIASHHEQAANALGKRQSAKWGKHKDAIAKHGAELKMYKQKNDL